MNNPSFRRTACSSAAATIFLLFGCQSRAQYAGTNGIFAEFNTSMGSYTCRLEHVLAPRTCASFIGLVTGQRGWLDLTGGGVKTNSFYDGTTFHRVIAGFVNQGGSPNGQGTDGPGYSFLDEFSPSLRHDGFGVLSMANSGPNSNGSQYFIAVSPQPQLNNVHSVFGRLYGGSNVVYAINHVATDANDKPVASVVISNITIQRIGASALAFDVNAQGLPLVTNLYVELAKVETHVNLTFSNRLYADNRLYASSDLTSWAGAELGIEIAAPVSNSITRSASAASQFFRMVQVQYPGDTLAPETLLSRTLALNFDDGWGTITIMFNATTGGSYTDTLGSPGTVTSYVWTQQPYRGYLSPANFSGVESMDLRLDFTRSSAGHNQGAMVWFADVRLLHAHRAVTSSPWQGQLVMD